MREREGIKRLERLERLEGSVPMAMAILVHWFIRKKKREGERKRKKEREREKKKGKINFHFNFNFNSLLHCLHRLSKVRINSKYMNPPIFRPLCTKDINNNAYMHR